MVRRGGFTRNNNNRASTKSTRFLVILVVWTLNHILVGALIAGVNCPVCDQRDCLLLLEREAFISQSATVQSQQLSLKPLHAVTCGELWSGNKTNRPVRSLGSMWGRCIDLRALLLHCTKQRGTHYTIPLGAILIQLSLWKGLFAWKVWRLRWRWQASFTVTLKMKPLDFPLSSQRLCKVALWCKRRWHALLC